REDRERVRVPLADHIAELDLCTVFDLQLRAVNDRVALLLAALRIDDGDGAVAVHRNQAAVVGTNGDEVDEVNLTRVLGFEVRSVLHARCGSADVEGTHGELRARLADGLRCDNADSLTHLNHLARAEVTAVAQDAAAALGFAGEHGANLYTLDTRCLNRGSLVFVDFLVDFDDGLTFVILQLFQRDAADDAVAQRLDGFAGFDDRHHVDAFHRAAIQLTDDDILRDVDETAGQVARVGGLECGIGETLTCAVRRDEVLQHGEAFTEVRRDGDRVHGSFLVGALHVVEHLVGHAFGNARPHLGDLVRALQVGDRAIQILLLHRDDLLFSFVHERVLGVGNDHVVEAHRQTRPRRILEAELLDLVQRLDGHFEAKVQVDVVDQLPHALLLEQAVDERHAVRKTVIKDGAADSGRDELL